MEKTIKELLMEMSEEEIISLLFEPKKYRPIWRFMQTIAGKKAIPDYDDLKWCQRALVLSKLCGWTIDEKDLRSTFVKYDCPKSRKRQKS